jgi:hypothetical protein
MATIQSNAWGILGSLNDAVVESILRIVGHNGFRCINRNGRVLANAWMKDGWVSRAKAVEGSEDSWRAYTDICELRFNHIGEAFHVRGNSDVVLAMMRAAFGKNVLGCSLSDYTCTARASHLFHKALVFDKRVFLMEDADFGLVHDTSPKIEVLRIEPFDDDRTFQRINVIARSIQPRIDGKDAETCIVESFVKLLDLNHENLCGNKTQSVRLSVSLRNLLSPTSIIPPSEDDVPNALGYIGGDVLAAYYRSKFDCRDTLYHITECGLPNFEGVFYARLWQGGPRFCVVNDGTYAFRTPEFPTAE